MNKFYIIFKNDNMFEGTTSATEVNFIKNIITPAINNIVSYQFWNEQELKDESDLNAFENQSTEQ